MAQNLARAVARLDSSSPFMINISIGVHVDSISIPLSPRGLSSSGEHSRTRKGDDIYTKTSYMCDILFASVVIRLLSIRCIKSTRNSTKLTAVVFSAGSPTTFNSDTIQYPPDLSSLFVMAVPCCVLSSKGPSLSRSLPLSLSTPRFCC